MADPVSAEAEFRARLEALNARFAAQLPLMLEKTAQALAACVASGATPTSAQLAALHESLHSVAGSAATFGYAMLGQQARRIEQQLRAAMQDGSGWNGIAPQVEQYLRWAARDPQATRYD